MKIRPITLIISIAIPLLVGGLASLLTMGSMEIFSALEQPPLSPPGWLFPIVWTVLYTLMGIACYLVIRSGGEYNKVVDALKVYGIQLLFNFLWTIIFFNLDLYYVAFAWLVVLWLIILVTIFRFYKLSRPAAYLMIPYIVWVTFAGYLNLGIAILN